MKRTRIKGRLIFAAGLMMPLPAIASQSGGNAEPLSAEGSVSAIIPPAGNYFLNYSFYTSADNFVTGNKLAGKELQDFHADVELDAVRFVHMTKLKILGADYGFDIVQPFARLNVGIGGRHYTQAGPSDTLIDPILLSLHSKRLHGVAAVRMFIPDGMYGAGNLGNIGTGHLAIAGVFGLTYLQPHGLELSALSFFTRKYQNDATKYNSGTEAQFDYFAGWHFGNLAVGAGGAFYRQLTADHGDSAVFGSFQGQSFSIGPDISYNLKGVRLEAKWNADVQARNRPRYNTAWIKIVTSF